MYIVIFLVSLWLEVLRVNNDNESRDSVLNESEGTSR